MELSVITNENIQKEKKVQEEIFNLIDNRKSFIFSSGAGSGKTYALAETLKYLIKHQEKNLKNNNQKIMCITYTNVAVKEVKERVGNSNLIIISTIHERIWELIKKYKKELTKIHKEKLEEEIPKLKQEIADNSKFSKYNDLSIELKNEFKEIMLGEKEVFYNKNNYNNAKNMEQAFEIKLEKFDILKKNIGNFKSIVNKLYKIEKYKFCLEEIQQGKNKPVNYNSTFNDDKLHRMTISHDTLLEYGLRIISEYDLLKQIVIDTYPYILIDEYQDTSENVIRIMEKLFSHAKEIQRNFVLGYFGDTAQNIYDGGIGRKIFDIHKKLKIVKKEFNRRSNQEIIDVTNRIREDEVSQNSIYSDCNNGNIEFFYMEENKEEIINQFIEETKLKWNINLENKLDCLILTNKLLARYSGFENIYSCFNQTDYYKDNYNQINSELLSHDLTKLGKIPLMVYKIIDFIMKLENPNTLLNDIIFDGNLTLFNVKKAVKLLCSIGGNSLDEFLKNLFKIYNETENNILKISVNTLFQNPIHNYNQFYSELLNELYPDIEEEKLANAKENLNNLLQINLIEYKDWHNFISNNVSKEILYHTYHGTKGLQFKNMVIIMQNDFGKNDKKLFSNFFKNFNKKDAIEDLKKHESAKNLLYVACSRAIKNLRILYVDDISSFKNNIEEIFGRENTKPFPKPIPNTEVIE